MYFLLYSSKSLFTYNEEQLREILKTACHNNKLLDITGLLLYVNDRFIQVLEGPKQSIQIVFDKIKDDNRHFELDVLAEGQIDKRLFNDWSMGLKQIELDEFEDITKFNSVEDFLAHQRNENDSIAIILMKHFLEESVKEQVFCY